KLLSVVASLGMMFVLIGGALVTKTGSGLGCGESWPLCEGQLFPKEVTPELVIELSHRLISGIMGFVVLALSILSCILIVHIREVKFIEFLSLLFMIFFTYIVEANVIYYV